MAARREDACNKMRTPLNSESGLDISTRGVFCLWTKLCTLSRVECPLWASHFPHCQRRGLFFTLAPLSIEVKAGNRDHWSAQQGQGSAGIQPSSESPRKELDFPLVVFKLSSVETWGFCEAPTSSPVGLDGRQGSRGLQALTPPQPGQLFSSVLAQGF